MTSSVNRISIIILGIYLSLFNAYTFSQQEYLIYFKDKGDAPYIELSSRSEQRRLRNGVSMDEYDRKVNPLYLDLLKSYGEVIMESRWLNGIRFRSTHSAAELQSIFPFIWEVRLVSRTGKIVKPMEPAIDKSLNYGVADTQIRQLGVDCLHDLGYTGSGVYLAVIDAGFSGLDTISCFQPMFNQNRLLDSFDFVNGGSIYTYSGHGTAVSSCIFGYRNDSQQYSGSSPDVDVALYVSEDVNSETLAEEFNLVAALERCDIQGVDLANISLGYVDFDNPADDHSYADRDGATTIAAIGVNVAATKGILVVSAAGNSGPDYISTPCDADDGLCVGAVDNLGNYAPFSSVGPASDGGIKPDLAATGWETWLYIDDGSLVMGNGTSFASPLTTGAAALLIQAHPWASIEQIKQALRQSAHQYLVPDAFMGYGIPNLCAANDSLEVLAEVVNLNESILTLLPNPASEWFEIRGLAEISEMEVRIVDYQGRLVKRDFLRGSDRKVVLEEIGRGVYWVEVENMRVRLLIVR